MKIRIVRSMGNYTEGAQFEIDDQAGSELIADGIAAQAIEMPTAVPLVIDLPPTRVTEVVKPKRRKRGDNASKDHE